MKANIVRSIVVAMSMTSCVALASSTTVGGIMWNYTVSEGKASIYKRSLSPAISSSSVGAITVPSTLGGYPVASIGAYAFYGCGGLTSVTIPDSVTSIGDCAFLGCHGLTSVTIPDSVTNIGYSALSDCSGLRDVVVPQYVLDQQICRIFPSCSSLTNITYSSVITNIGSSAFKGCSGLTSVTIPASVTSIGQYAFWCCRGLTSVTIPNSVTSIGYYAFADCSRLTSVAIPDSVTSIGACAFSSCNGLTSVTIGKSVTSIGSWAFVGEGGTSMKWFSVSEDNPSYESVAGLLLTKDGTTLIAGVNGDVTIPASVTDIGDRAFFFYGGLTSVTIPASVTNIGDFAFHRCGGMKWFSVSGDNPSYKSVAGLLLTKDGTTLIAGVNGDVTIPDGVTSIGHDAFSYLSGLTSVTIPDSVTSIGDWAFWGCSGLKSVSIPDGVTSIGEWVFRGCSGLISVTIPASVTSIGDRAFSGCSGLTSVTIPASVTSIGDWAFYCCYGLTRITIPETVTSIGDAAFKDCGGLMNVYVSIGDAERVKGFMTCSGFDVSGVSFIELDMDVFPKIVGDANAAMVNATIDGVGFVDATVKEAIGGSVKEYNAFKTWSDGVKGATGDALAGEAAVVANAHAAAAYLLGAERLFVNEPTVEIGELAIVDGESAGTTTMTVAVTVKDGASAVVVDAAKVAAMFEATGDLGDWNGAAKLTPTVTTSGTDASGKMTFVVTPGDGTAAKAFLRIRK